MFEVVTVRVNDVQSVEISWIPDVWGSRPFSIFSAVCRIMGLSYFRLIDFTSIELSGLRLLTNSCDS